MSRPWLQRLDPRGLTFTELVVAMSLLFLVGTILMELSVSASRCTLQARERSTATLLAQSKLESAMTSSRVPFSGQISSYLYSVELLDDEKEFKIIRVTVTAPGGARTSMEVLRSSDALY